MLIRSLLLKVHSKS